MSDYPKVPSVRSRSNSGDEAKEPLQKKPNLSSSQPRSQPLTFVDLSDEIDHVSLNKDVLSNLGETPSITEILNEVIRTCKSLNEELARLQKIRELLAKEPELEALVKDAWLKKDFTRIRKLAILQKDLGSNKRDSQVKHDFHTLGRVRGVYTPYTDRQVAGKIVRVIQANSIQTHLAD